MDLPKVASVGFARVLRRPPCHSFTAAILSLPELSQAVMFGVVASCRLAVRQRFSFRQMHSTPAVLMRRNKRSSEEDTPVEDADLDPPEFSDNSSVVHMRFRQHRKILYYMRLIEHELPQLVGASPA